MQILAHSKQYLFAALRSGDMHECSLYLMLLPVAGCSAYPAGAMEGEWAVICTPEQYICTDQACASTVWRLLLQFRLWRYVCGTH
jgi:hypothetical protein